jgi:hypothetical protein
MQADKVITSLLFSSVMERDAFAILSMRFEELIRQKKYQHSVPALQNTELKDGRVKCLLDFTDRLNSSLEYCAALDQFLIQYEQLLCDIVLLEQERAFRLSALVSIDSELATFELRVPRIPSELGRFQSFSFDYWVWHICDAGPESEASQQCGS